MARLATPDGTAAYAARHPAGEGSWRNALGLTLSSIGFGSYLGAEDEESDRAYVEAFVEGLRGGVNVLDTAANYRARRSERCVGEALRAAGVPREQVLVVTKAGFIPIDMDADVSPQEAFHRDYVASGVVSPGDVVAGCHVMTPAYVDHELHASLDVLGLDAVDVHFLHNPETQLEAGIPRDAFEARLRDCFALLEERRQEGKVGVYGLATWNGLRRPPNHPGHVSIERALALARQVGGENHGLRALELPLNLAMAEAAVKPTQAWRGRHVPVLAAAREAGLLVLGSATLMQTRLLGAVPSNVRDALGARTDLEAAVQFSRSMPGMTTALVGTGRLEHARENVSVARLPTHAHATRDLLPGGEEAYHTP